MLLLYWSALEIEPYPVTEYFRSAITQETYILRDDFTVFQVIKSSIPELPSIVLVFV